MLHECVPTARLLHCPTFCTCVCKPGGVRTAMGPNSACNRACAQLALLVAKKLAGGVLPRSGDLRRHDRAESLPQVCFGCALRLCAERRFQRKMYDRRGRVWQRNPSYRKVAEKLLATPVDPGELRNCPKVVEKLSNDWRKVAPATKQRPEFDQNWPC